MCIGHGFLLALQRVCDMARRRGGTCGNTYQSSKRNKMGRPRRSWARRAVSIGGILNESIEIHTDVVLYREIKVVEVLHGQAFATAIQRAYFKWGYQATTMKQFDGRGAGDE